MKKQYVENARKEYTNIELLQRTNAHFFVHTCQEKDAELHRLKLKHRPMWIKAEKWEGGCFKKWVVQMVGEVTKHGGWSAGRRRCKLQLFPPLERS